jgi:hypothetical protein
MSNQNLMSGLILLSCLICNGCFDQKMILVEKGVARVPIVLAPGASPATAQAAKEMADYIEKISGARPEVLNGATNPVPESAIWVGIQSNVPGLSTKVKIEFQHPEEILLACDGKNVIITGRDRMAGTNQVEYGTANAVYSFLQDKLGVRWLWPGPLGEDIVKNDTISFKTFEYRFYPPFRVRHFWPRNPREWHQYQRTYLYSLNIGAGHAFTKWWEEYHADHPDYFALQPDGSRDAFPSPQDVKICVSNPKMQARWLDNAEKAFKEHPEKIMFSASPNDGSMSGECVCKNCRAWDNTNGVKVMLYGKGGPEEYVALTDRYIHFWNILARGLKERFPDREVMVGALAYGPYITPPVAEVLEKNIAIFYVGHFPLAGDEQTQKEKERWKGWADKASTMVFRPNLFHYSGGWLGLPTVATRRTIEDFRFLAENKCVGVEVDTLPRCWATQGVQFYLMAQLAYDPMRDGNAVLKDYYRRGFGKAAGEVEQYFNLMEKAHEAILGKIKHSSGWAREAIVVYREVYTDEILNASGDLMREAAAKVADGPEIFQKRVAFIRSGYDFTRLQVEIMRAMAQVRESKGKDAEAVKKAVKLCEERETLLKKSPEFALNAASWYHNARKLDDYMGPPSAAILEAAGIKTNVVKDVKKDHVQ